jgi:hypothetical protein
MIIKPTIGRIVWYKPRLSMGFGPEVILAAIITSVHKDDVINIAAFSPDGNIMPKTGVYLAQEGVDHPFKDNYAMWMPYQVGQAKNHTLKEAFATQVVR